LKRIRWTPLAISDLKAISSYIEEQRNLGTANGCAASITTPFKCSPLS
jgi:plasmid stabilization system protein ParE